MPVGSPPRVRGEAFVRYFGSQTAGITPACAGRSRQTGKDADADQDHPRVCGEKHRPGAAHILDDGSPPRVRGEVCPVATGELCPGITPACAGRSVTSLTSDFSFVDHPRVCGEKHGGNSATQRAPGSPPRVRGEACKKSLPQQPTGITPACAGRRLAHAGPIKLYSDHPRVCGEKAFQVFKTHCSVGSPPRVRGEENSLNATMQNQRITPACAGRR